VELKDQMLARMYVVLTLMSIVPALIVFQVLRIHVADGEELREQGERQTSSFVTIPAIRGAILDRGGRMLAVNTARYDLALDPTVAGFGNLESSFFERLSKLTGRSAASFRRKVLTRKSPQYVFLLRGIDERQKEAIESWNVPGILLDPSFARRYNYGPTASHVLGHVSADGQGLSGLELQYDSYLNGVDGRRTVKRDRLGHIKAYVKGKVVEPRHGESLFLTIDLIRQTILEEELARGVAEMGAMRGSAVALDPNTGAVLAMTNVPTYDPNRPTAYDTEARRNAAITDRLEPGSTFKIVAAAAAIEQGIVAMDDSIDTGDGWAVIQGRTLHDTHANGTLSFEDVIALSSNIGTAKVVSSMKPGTLYQYARNLGFGHPTWIDLPGEVPGLLKRPESWSATTLTSVSIGYEVDVTPLQLATAYAALANGGLLVQPHVVSERRDVTGKITWRARQDSVRRAFRAETARTLLPAFERAVNEGTGTNAQIEGLSVAGKTGTARKVIGGSYAPGAYRASFVGFFPADDPKVVLAVVLDEPESARYGGSAAAPIFQRTAQRWIATFPEIAQRMSPDIELPETPDLPVPDVRGLPAFVAERSLRSEGFNARVRSNEDYFVSVSEQNPRAGDSTRLSDVVRLVVADGDQVGPDQMPDVRGLSSRNALLWLRSLGIEVTLNDVGTVVAQSPPPGNPVPGRAVLRSR
jgi:cell division protein FtsI (penicillin-binding protein 3)